MEILMNLMTEYREAFMAANGYQPEISMVGKRYAVTTRTGSHSGYTERDIRNLVCGLKMMIGRK